MSGGAAAQRPPRRWGDSQEGRAGEGRAAGFAGGPTHSRTTHSNPDSATHIEAPRRVGRARHAGGTAHQVRLSGRLKAVNPWSFRAVWIIALIFLALGLCMMLSVSVAGSIGSANPDRYSYVRSQGLTAAVGLIGLVLVSRMNYRKLGKVSVVAMVAVVFILMIMHIPGVSRSEGGAASWIPVGPIHVQPSEYAKLVLVVAGAYLMSTRRGGKNDFRSFMIPFGATGSLMCLLIVAEPDLGTAIILAGLLMGLLFLGGMRLRHWVPIVGLGVIGAMAFTFSSDERMGRVLSFLNPSADPQGASFQLVQSQVALGRGGWLGAGPGESVQKFSYLPKAHTDMIFAIVGEELGLIGAGFVILLFGIFAVACWRLARHCADPMGKLLVAGCGMLVILQAVVNIGGVIGAMPLTGVPLPFISYGRNSLIVMLLAVGLILSVARSAPAYRVSSVAERYENVTNLDRGWGDGRARGAGTGAG